MSSHLLCPITSYTLQTSDGSESWSNSSRIALDLNTTLLNILPDASFTETIRLHAINFEGGATNYIQIEISTCNETNTQVELPLEMPVSPFLRTPGNLTGNFTFFKFTSNVTNCPITQMYLTNSNIAPEPTFDSIVFTGALNCSENEMCTVDVDSLTKLEYSFFIYMRTSGGAYKYSSTKYKIVFPPPVISTAPPPNWPPFFETKPLNQIF